MPSGPLVDEQHWQDWWEQQGLFHAEIDWQKPKMYVLDMFPYPSGAGLHVGHPLGYIATDVYARYKKMQGYNVLHPMGFDAFGLPAEQYAIQTGRHPAETTMENIRRYRQQLKKIGLAYDWRREVITCDPKYYKWTQWIFIQLFHSWYDTERDCARPIQELEQIFAERGNRDVPAYTEEAVPPFSAEDWQRFSWAERQRILMHYRLAYLAEAEVNWCEALGTVLANEEVEWDEQRGLISIRGGHPVVRKPMKQWFLRIRAYAHRLLNNLNLPLLKAEQKEAILQALYNNGQNPLSPEKAEQLLQTWKEKLNTVIEQELADQPAQKEQLLARLHKKEQWLRNRIEAGTARREDFLCALRDIDGLQWSDAVKEAQRNWIGKSEGAEILFPVEGSGQVLRVFTTRPDTLFGVTFIAIAPEHPLVEKLVPATWRAEVRAFVERIRNMPERTRLMQGEPEGIFTGAYARHPVTGARLPIWLANYVLLGYGTGIVMAVPAHDQRDWLFARKYQLPIKQVIRHPNADVTQRAWEEKEGILFDSQFLDGLEVPEAIARAIQEVEKRGIGKRRTTYRLRDFLFSRQRYWGEPIPMVFVPVSDGGEPIPVPVTDLPNLYREGILTEAPPEEVCQIPVVLPDLKDFTPTGEPPLARLKDWVHLPGGLRREVNTMPGWAGSNWYFIRYLDPQNDQELVSRDAEQYWGPVDLYVGGAEHATAHLIYARFINMFLYDIGVVSWEEPFKRLYNQGMILGPSYFIYVDWEAKKAYSRTIAEQHARRSTLVKVRIPTAYINEREELDLSRLDALKQEVPELAEVEFVPEEDGRFLPADRQIEKMSKSMRNTINPDEIIERWGADAFRLYEMFMGPLNESKPWDVRGITGTYRFLQRVWRLFVNEHGEIHVEDRQPSPDALRTLHTTIHQVSRDIETLNLNTAVSALMICLNRLVTLGERSRTILEPFLQLLAPFAPHLAEELWHRLGHQTSIFESQWPRADTRWLQAETITYPVMVNGKKRFTVELPAQWTEDQIRSAVLADERLYRYVRTREAIKRVIVVRGRIVNVVV